MEFQETEILQADDFVSKAFDSILKTGTAVTVLKGKEYYGIIDDRHLRLGISDPHRVKCETIAVRAPPVFTQTNLFERMKMFLSGHFKGLSLLDAKTKKPLGIHTRLDLLKEMKNANIIPNTNCHAIMNAPVYTVGFDADIATAKRLLKAYNCNRLIVMRNNYPYGVFSTFDLLGMAVAPKGRKDHIFISEIKNTDHERVSEYVRDKIALIDSSDSLKEAVELMLLHKVSFAVVSKEKKAVGIISATDIFMKIVELAKDEQLIAISGLDEHEQYDHIKQGIMQITAKFSALRLTNISVHCKKGKSVTKVNLFFEIRGKPQSIFAEGYDMTEAIHKLVDEFSALLRKEKGKREKKLKGEF